MTNLKKLIVGSAIALGLAMLVFVGSIVASPDERDSDSRAAEQVTRGFGTSRSESTGDVFLDALILDDALKAMSSNKVRDISGRAMR